MGIRSRASFLCHAALIVNAFKWQGSSCCSRRAIDTDAPAFQAGICSNIFSGCPSAGGVEQVCQRRRLPGSPVVSFIGVSYFAFHPYRPSLFSLLLSPPRTSSLSLSFSALATSFTSSRWPCTESYSHASAKRSLHSRLASLLHLFAAPVAATSGVQCCQRHHRLCACDVSLLSPLRSERRFLVSVGCSARITRLFRHCGCLSAQVSFSALDGFPAFSADSCMDSHF